MAIEGIGVVGGFGCGVADLKGALREKKAVPPRKTVQAPQGGQSLAAYLVPDTSPLKDFVSSRATRRMDHFSRMALLAAWLALEDAGRPDLSGERVGLVVATGYGASRSTFAFLDSVIDDGDACASPTLFSNSVHNAAGGYLSILLKADGPALTVSQFEMSVPTALLSAGLWLAEGRVDRVLFGGVDEYCDVLGYCWRRFFGEQAGGAMKPMQFDRQTAVVGEGAAFFLLTHAERIAPRYGFIANVQVGSSGSAQVQLPGDAVLILGADGHRKCCSRYAQYLSADRTFVCYTPLYGSLPIGQAFDMAIAALSIQDNRIFAPPDYSVNEGEAFGRVVQEDQALGSKEVCCLKLGGAGEVGFVTLARD
jgi:3-oxoacyl-[acyl-carrier-protein] synthase II